MGKFRCFVHDCILIEVRGEPNVNLMRRATLIYKIRTMENKTRIMKEQERNTQVVYNFVDNMWTVWGYQIKIGGNIKKMKKPYKN